jgi:hypothetical protein
MELKFCIFLGGVIMVSVVAIGPKVRGIKSRRIRWIFKGGKNPHHASLRRVCEAVVRFYGRLKICANFDGDIWSDKFKDISRQIPVSLLGVSAATRELWWMNQE